MKKIISKLVVLADGLDRLGLKKDADKIDRLITMAGRGRGPEEDFGDLMSLFEDPRQEDGRLTLEFDESDEGAPFRRPVTQVPEEAEVLTEIEPLDEPAQKKGPSRIEEIKRRHELLKLKKSLEAAEPVEDEDEEEEDRNVLPVASPDDFEDEGEDEGENEADDGGLFDTLKEKLKGAPELAKQVLMLIKDNPELLELLAL